MVLGRAGGLERTTARYIAPGSRVYDGNLALFPGMTADCSIITNRKEDILRVPSAALRFNPAAFLPPSELRAVLEQGAGPGAGGHGAGSGVAGPGAGSGSGSGSRGMVARLQDRIWTLDGGRLKAVPVKVGITDGMYTEVNGEGLTPGLAVVTGVDDLKKAQNGGGGPLMGGMHH